jgi:hypothetical protein
MKSSVTVVLGLPISHQDDIDVLSSSIRTFQKTPSVTDARAEPNLHDSPISLHCKHTWAALKWRESSKLTSKELPEHKVIKWE